MQTLLFGKEARQKIKDGIDKTVNMVKVTLGASGRNVIIKRSFNTQGYGLQYMPATYTKDGVGIVRSIELPDAVENAGCDLVKDACERTMASCGDATTTTAVLLQAIVEEGLNIPDTANPMEVKKGIDSAVERVVEELKLMAIPIGDDVEKVRQIASVSANNDKSIGDLIAQAFEKIGKDGIIDIAESKSAVTEIKVTDGVKIAKGWVSPYFINNPAKNECELNEPYILLYDKAITQLKPLENILGQIMGANASILIVCENADGEALAALAMNAAQKRLNCCIINSPEFGDFKRDYMEDLATVTGGEYISTEKGTSLEKASLKQLGRAAKVVVGKDETKIISGKGDKDKLKELVDKLKAEAEIADPAEKEAIQKRVAKLNGSVAVLYVGAATEVEMKERKDRCDDAVRATRAALEEGYLPGGGTAFMRCKLTTTIGATTNFQMGEAIIGKILTAPLHQICKNAGVDSKDIVEKAMKLQGNTGYNAVTGSFENLVVSGIIDPVKSLRSALQNAASAAGAVITSEGLIV